MVTVQDVFAFLDAQAPVRYQMDFDNAGFLAGNPQSTVQQILVTLDITDDVIEEAVEAGAQLIVSHHPLIFKPLKRVTADDLTGRKILRMAANGLSAVCMHTNLDIAEGGVNDALMAALDAGAENFEATEEEFIVYTDIASFSQVREKLEEGGYTFTSAELEWVPQTMVSVAGTDADKLDKLVENLEDLDDVQNVFHNGEME